jgi:hypothetical protein
MTNAAYLLAHLRCVRLRMMLATGIIDEIGLALTHNMITPEAAVQWLHDEGFDDLLPTVQPGRVAA